MSKLKTHKLNFETEYQIRPAAEKDKNLLKWADINCKDYYDEKWTKKMEGKQDMYVAVINEYPIAYIWLDWTKLEDRKTAEISSFVVMQPFQSRGIGTAMMNFVENIIREKKLKIAQTGTYKFNVRATSLYQRLGYKITDEQIGSNYKMENGKLVVKPEVCFVLEKYLS